jgi:hypothetical protein
MPRIHLEEVLGPVRNEFAPAIRGRASVLRDGVMATGRARYLMEITFLSNSIEIASEITESQAFESGQTRLVWNPLSSPYGGG